MNMRKIIAVLAAVLLLCAAIPMAALSVSAAGNCISNGTFESGTGSWGKSTNTVMTVEDGALKATHGDDWAYVYTKATLTPNTDYTLTFRAKADKGGFKINFNDTSWNSAKETVPSLSPAITTEWKEFELEFNSAGYSALLLFFQSNQYGSAAQTIWLDDVVVIEKVDEPVTPEDPDLPANAIYTEDFEDGALGGWSSSTSSVAGASEFPVANAAGGNYAMKFVSTNYSYTNYSLAVEKNTTYRVQYSILSAEASRPLNVRIRTSGSVDLAYNQHAGSTAAWQTFTMVFNSGDNTALNFRFQSAHTTCTYYIDNLSVTPVNVNQKNDGYLKNGNFETGKADNWDYTPSSSYVADPTNSGQGYVLQTNEAEKVNMIAQPVNIVEGKEYVLYFKIYGYSTATNSAIYVRLGAPANTTWDTSAIKTTMAANGGDVSDSWTRQVRLNMNSNTGKWCYVAVPFTAAKTTAINVAIYNYRASEGKYYFDDFVVFEKKAASNDGYIINGDFETGTTEGLSVSGQTVVSPSAAKDGNFGLHMKNQSGGWGGVGQWAIAGLEVGATYKMEMDMKAVSKGVNWTLWQGAYNSGTKYASGYFATAEWTHIEKEFVANEATAVLNINGGNAGVSEDVYLDNLKLTKIKDAHTCNVVEQDRVDATCTTDGYISYACDCGLGAYTETIPAKGHTAGAAADCENAQVCTVCGAELAAALGHDWNDATCTAPKTCSVCGATEGDALGHVYDNDCDPDCNVCFENREELNHNVIHVAAKAATCTATGNIEYWYCDACGMAWLDEACTLNTNLRAVNLPMAEHTYFDDCSAICEACGYEREAGHNVIHVAAKDATCTAMGNIEYWYCDACGMAWLDEACTLNTNLRAVNLPMAEHTYFDDCSAICEVCGYEREAGHNVIHVAAKAATCTEMGNIEYWYCDACGMAWLDAECTMNTNLRAVKLAATGEHTYDNAFDTTCNECGAVRAVAGPVSYIAKSISEDVSGLAMLFQADVEGIVVKAGTFVQADYTNATYNGYKLVKLGVIASNGVSETNIEGVRMYDLEDGCAKFAFRVINIPADKLDVEITMTPYYIVEIDGVETTLYGAPQTGSYAEIAG